MFCQEGQDVSVRKWLNLQIYGKSVSYVHDKRRGKGGKVRTRYTKCKSKRRLLRRSPSASELSIISARDKFYFDDSCNCNGKTNGSKVSIFLLDQVHSATAFLVHVISPLHHGELIGHISYHRIARYPPTTVYARLIFLAITVCPKNDIERRQ